MIEREAKIQEWIIPFTEKSDFISRAKIYDAVHVLRNKRKWGIILSNLEIIWVKDFPRVVCNYHLFSTTKKKGLRSRTTQKILLKFITQSHV